MNQATFSTEACSNIFWIGLSVGSMLAAGAGSLPQVLCCSTISSMSDIVYSDGRWLHRLEA